jgi:ribulose-phosphate 3-epimerase
MKAKTPIVLSPLIEIIKSSRDNKSYTINIKTQQRNHKTMPPLKKILPAIIANNQLELDQMLAKIPFAKNVMLDLMDGNFVKTKSLNFPMNLPKNHRYQLHIMATNPLERLNNLPPNIDTAIIHKESLSDISEAINQSLENKLDLFIALNPETPISVVEPYLDSLKGILIMTVNPGQYGAKFLPEQLKKVKKLRQKSKDINLEVDGGMNDKTIGLAVEAGANIIASGSFIMNSINPREAYIKLHKFIK